MAALRPVGAGRYFSAAGGAEALFAFAEGYDLPLILMTVALSTTRSSTAIANGGSPR